eukprot:scaffold50087_cov15-Tisochrysis_lutea.AAC.1
MERLADDAAWVSMSIREQFVPGSQIGAPQPTKSRQELAKGTVCEEMLGCGHSVSLSSIVVGRVTSAN